jgi:BMFP domain-containing protein YqiC
MEPRNRLFDDLAKLAGSAAGSLSGVKTEVEARVRQHLEDLVSRLDLVTREDFDTALAVAVKARAEQEVLTRRVAELEMIVAKLEARGRTVRRPKIASKRQAGKQSTPRRR